MSQITLTLDEDIAAVVYQMAHAENVTPSFWLSQFVERQVKQHQGWSPEVKALAGSWADFPSLDEIRSVQGDDAERESL